MPVIFVLFKGVTKTSLSWISKLRYLTRHPSAPSHPQSDVQMLRYEQVGDEHKLPQVPKGTLTGLRSCMRNKNRTTPAVGDDTTVALQSGGGGEMLTYVSADYDYHRQLKIGAVGGGGSEIWAGQTQTPGTPPSSRGKGAK